MALSRGCSSSSGIGRRRRPQPLLVRCGAVTDGETGERLCFVLARGSNLEVDRRKLAGLEQHPRMRLRSAEVTIRSRGIPVEVSWAGANSVKAGKAR
jgi:hypothetical protein